MRIGLIIATVLMGITSLVISVFSLFNTMSINPFGNDFTTRTYTDSQDHEITNSQVESFTKNGDGFVLNYHLGTNRLNPYAGVLFENHTWNLNKYDRITVEINPEQCDPFTLLFADFVPGFSDSGNDLTWRIYEYEINPREGKSRYSIELDEFITPTWWIGQPELKANFDRYQGSFERSPANKLSRIQQIQFQNHPLNGKDSTFQITVSSLKFSHMPLQSAPYWIVTAFLALLTTAMRKRKSIPIPYRQLEVESRLSEEETLIVTFIGNHYARPDMTLSLVSLETGISQKQIRKVLITSFDKSFKQYLTEIRLQEARRLLLETDRLIADVALYVGYKHATTFTRLFREHFGSSPRDFRERERK